MDEERLHLTDASVLPPSISEILPLGMPRTHCFGRFDREALIQDQFAERGAPARLPVRVVPVGVLDQRFHLTAAAGRGVANAMRDLVREPQRDNFGVEP